MCGMCGVYCVYAGVVVGVCGYVCRRYACVVWGSSRCMDMVCGAGCVVCVRGCGWCVNVYGFVGVHMWGV